MMVSTSKAAAGGNGVAAEPSSTACTDHTGTSAEHLAGGLPIPTSCPATRKLKGVSGSSAKALQKGSQYDRNSAGEEQTWYGFLLAHSSCHLYPLQKLPASASGRLRRSNIHSLLSRNRCYTQLERLYCQTSCGCYAGWMCCKLTVSLTGCRCCHRQFLLSRMCIAQCC